jgi:glycosyltransferase involved in cell wall biosynthesis
MSLRVLLLNWRDLHHPEAGGAEKYLVTVAEGLASRGHEVTFRTAGYPGAVREETISGVRYVRRGGHYSIYPRAVLGRRQAAYDVVVDVQNGVPYLSPLVTRTPVVNLVHHVHREQWPVVFGPRAARLGWWLEASVAPLVYRRSTYVAVSHSTRRELIELGVDPERITLIHNGTDAVADGSVERSPDPRVVVLGRLVPQKRVEIALEAVAALRARIPRLHVDVVGTGWWEPNLRAHAAALGIDELVTFHGHVSEGEKHRLLGHAWVHAMPSLKEGWGLVVVEAGVHGTPTVAFREAGGPADSIKHEETGLLVDNASAPGDGGRGYAEALARLLTDDDVRLRMSDEVRAWVSQFHWEDCVESWERLLLREVRKRPVSPC